MTHKRSRDQLEELQVIAGRHMSLPAISALQGLGVCPAVGLDLAATNCLTQACVTC